MTTPDVWTDAELIWDYHQMHHEPAPASVAIGLGSHDLGVADVAASLYLKSLVPLLLFTGSNSPTTRERMPRGEAVHYKERAVELGVLERDILIEPQASNTGENITFSRAVLAEHGIDAQSVTLTCKPYEERRAYATARKLWPEVEVRCASAHYSLADYVATIGDEKKVVDMLVGALQRLMIYPDQGFMIKQEVPADVVAAFRRLRDRGFTSRLVSSE